MPFTSRNWRVPLLTLAVIITGALVGSAATVGCGDQCDRDPSAPVVKYTGGETKDGVYTSSGFHGPYLDFPPGRIYRFTHDLGGPPRDIQGWFAFDTAPAETSNDASVGSGTAQAGGNQFTVLRVTDQTFDVYNDTCSDVKLRVEASDPDLTAPANPAIRDAATD